MHRRHTKMSVAIFFGYFLFVKRGWVYGFLLEFVLGRGGETNSIHTYNSSPLKLQESGHRIYTLHFNHTREGEGDALFENQSLLSCFRLAPHPPARYPRPPPSSARFRKKRPSSHALPVYPRSENVASFNLTCPTRYKEARGTASSLEKKRIKRKKKINFRRS